MHPPAAGAPLRARQGGDQRAHLRRATLFGRHLQAHVRPSSASYNGHGACRLDVSCGALPRLQQQRAGFKGRLGGGVAEKGVALEAAERVGEAVVHPAGCVCAWVTILHATQHPS